MALTGALLIGGCMPIAYATVPPDPSRPMQAGNCREALARLREAIEGNPLVDVAENRKHVMAALEQAERLCGK